MKKVFNLIAIMALALAPVVATSCGDDTKTKKEDTEKAEEAEKAEKTEVPDETPAVAKGVEGTVRHLTDDTTVRPGMSVSRLTILDFNATWCGPCKQLTPVFDAAAGKFADKVDFVSIDIDKCPETANAFGVEAVPTVVFLYPDGKSTSFVGTGDLLPAEKFEALVNKSLAE